MELLSQYGIFLLKVITIVVAILVVVGGMVSISARNKMKHHEGRLVVKKLNDDIEDHQLQIDVAVCSDAELKALDKKRKKEEKAEAKEHKKATKLGQTPTAKPRVFVLDFDGDIKASEVELMRREITAVLTRATKEDEIIVRLESAGGMVHTYGLAASQLQRIRDRGIPLTICVDKVAASGGYMMACLADRLVAAPFAIIGSIGVVAQLPNFNRLLKKNDVDFELFTAGEYKRTVTMFGQNTDKAKEKFQSDLNETHDLFKDHVQHFRPRIDINAVATGDIWYGRQAIDQRLIDEVRTSDELITERCDSADVYSVRYEYKKSIQEKLGLAAESAISRAATKVLTLMTAQQHNKG